MRATGVVGSVRSTAVVPGQKLGQLDNACEGMLIPLMVALIPKIFCSQRLADYVGLRGWSTRHRHVPQLIITSPGLLES